MAIKNFDDLLSQTNARKFISDKFIDKGLSYISKDVTMNEDEILNYSDGSKSYDFDVYSSEHNMYYTVSIWLKDTFIKRVNCNCNNFFTNHTCEHIVAVLNNKYNQLFNYSSLSDIKIMSKQILKNFSDLKNKGNVIKKEAYIELEIDLGETFRYYSGYSKTVTPKLMIGTNKMYVMGPHISQFEKVVRTGHGTVKFGKDFVFDPDLYYFSPESNKLIESYIKLINGKYNRYFYDDELKEFFNDIKDQEFVIGKYQVDGIKNDFPVESNLIKNDKNEYELTFNLENVEKILDDYEYILYNGKFYHLSTSSQELLSELEKGSFDHLEFDEEDVETFTNGLLAELKNNIAIDDKIDNIVLPSSLKCELYFDLRIAKIICDMKFIYDDIKVDYFDKDSLILRDTNYEKRVLNDLLKWGFKIEKDKLILDDINDEVEFLDNGLEYLANFYPVFTTEKFKNINVTKKTNITSSFSIGSDNILNFTFNLNGLNPEELVNIFDNIRNKKKFYRLKSGDIISLESNDLIELASLADELELTDEEIIAGQGKLQKYRAIYLDSLKNRKYDIIKTDNLFDNFIDNFYQYKDASLTLKDTSVLRPYQLTGVKWLYNLDQCSFGGILADEMGLGKTIQIIYYIRQILLNDKDAKFLIVVPTSLSYNWEHEFNLFAPEISKVLCVGTKDKRIKILSSSTSSVFITSYGTLREDEELYQDKHYHAMIIDEAQNIKNNRAGITKSVKSINADTKFALTGTPLENSVLELWSIFDFIMPGYLSNLTRFQSKYKIKDYDSVTEELLKGLSHQINPFMLRRKKEDVLSDLPDKLINDIYIELTPKQKELYAAEATKVKKEMSSIIQKDGISKARFMILQLLTKLRQIVIDPGIVYDDYHDGSSKIDTLKDIVSEYIENGHKMLIFSSFRTALEIVKDEFEKMGVKLCLIDGQTPANKRMEMVNSFNEDDSIKVFLIMLKAGGTGLNLTGADTVIHLDLWWNPQAENQATDRAHRIGQTKNVEVIHLIANGTIEEKILELQNKKQTLSDKLIDGEAHDENLISSLSENEIKELLSFENKDN